MGTRKQAMSDYLPDRLPVSLRRERVSRTDFGGFSRSGASDMYNMSPRLAPELASRMPRGLLVDAVGDGDPHGMACFDGRIFIARGTHLYSTENGMAVKDLGTVSDTDKQFFVFGDRLYVYPDKIYVNKGGNMPVHAELDTGVIEQVDFSGSKVTLPEGMNWLALGFQVGDVLRVINADDVDPAPEGDYHLVALRGREATVAGVFPSVHVSDVRFLRTVPALERVCVCGDRVFGTKGQDIYISAAGSAMDFYSKGMSDGEKPLILHTDTGEGFTACMPWQGYVIFFKEDRICKLVGTRADSFALYETPAVGIPASLADTLCEVDGALFYCTDGGVYRYRGQTPERVAAAGEKLVTAGRGGTDGYAYYLAVEQGTQGWRQYLYLPRSGTWYAEDTLHPTGMVRRGGYLLIQDANGYVWMTSSDGRATGCSMDERYVSGTMVSSVTLPCDGSLHPDGGRLIHLYIRATAEAGAMMDVMCEYANGQGSVDADGTREILLGTYKGRMTDRLLRIPVTPCFCDGVTLRFLMRGAWVIHAVTYEYERSGQ